MNRSEFFKTVGLGCLAAVMPGKKEDPRLKGSTMVDYDELYARFINGLHYGRGYVYISVANEDFLG